MEKDAAKLEETFVYEVYDNIASHFDHTRHSQWGGVKRFLHSLSPYSLVADVGCGNGKYLTEDALVKMGCDRSEELCKICNNKGYSVFVADCLALPLVNDKFDAILSIAVIHHLVTQERRIRAIQEIVTRLRPGGRALIYVWAFEQRHRGETSVYLKNSCHEDDPCSTCTVNKRMEEIQITDDVLLPVHDNRTPFQAQDLLVPWIRKQKRETSEGTEEEKYLRFYHVFREGELETLCSSVPDCTVRHSFYEQGNWCVELERR